MPQVTYDRWGRPIYAAAQVPIAHPVAAGTICMFPDNGVATFPASGFEYDDLAEFMTDFDADFDRRDEEIMQ